MSKVRVYAKDVNNNITDIGSTNLDINGSGGITSSVQLKGGENLIFVVDEKYNLSSSIRYVTVVDPWGYVYDSVSKERLSGVKITVLDGSGSLVNLPTLNGIPQANPFYSDATGFYASYELPGTYRVTAEKTGYTFASTKIAIGSPNLD